MNAAKLVCCLLLVVGLAGCDSDSKSRCNKAGSDQVSIFCLESNYGSPTHWKRLVKNAKDMGVTRLVWCRYDGHVSMPNLYRWLPDFHDAWDWKKEGVIEHREALTEAAAMTHEAGMEFFLWYPAVHFGLSDRKKIQQTLPELFRGDKYPDVNTPFFSYFLKEQLREIYQEFPLVDGIALWMCENSQYPPGRLSKHAPLDSVLETCVDAFYSVCSEEKRKLVGDIHSSGGSAEVTGAMIKAYAKHPDIVIQTDATWGDYSLTCPTSVFIPEIAKNNPVMINFDCYGEYFGRNVVPTIYLNWIRKHWQNARVMAGEKLVGVDGRVSTANDNWSPHFEILPRFVREFPSVPLNLHRPANTGKDRLILELSCFETFSRAHAVALQQLKRKGKFDSFTIIRDMCKEEFGNETAEDLAGLLAQVESVLVSIYYVNEAYFGTQSVVWPPDSWILKVHHFYDLFKEPGSDLRGSDYPFDGDWPVRKGLKTISFEEMTMTIEQGMHTAEHLLNQFREKIKSGLNQEDAVFLDRQFLLLKMTAEVRYYLFQVMYYHYFLKQGNTEKGRPEELARCNQELERSIDAFETLLGSEDVSTIVPTRKWISMVNALLKTI